MGGTGWVPETAWGLRRSFLQAISTGIVFALSGVLTAVDRVVLKQAVEAWIRTPTAEQAARLTIAEAIQWLEWGTNNYWNIMQGLALVL